MYRLTFGSDKPDELVAADEIRYSSTTVRLLRERTVMGRPCTIVARRSASAGLRGTTSGDSQGEA